MIVKIEFILCIVLVIFIMYYMNKKEFFNETRGGTPEMLLRGIGEGKCNDMRHRYLYRRNKKWRWSDRSGKKCCKFRKGQPRGSLEWAVGSGSEYDTCKWKTNSNCKDAKLRNEQYGGTYCTGISCKYGCDGKHNP
jgi:hypothetical protein